MTPVAATDLDAALEALRRQVRGLTGGALVAFSGGVDSALLLRVCRDELGPRVVAATADSPSFPELDRRDAAALARRIGVEHVWVHTHEMEDERYRRNDAERCYFCKHTLFATLLPIARDRGLEHLLFGANKDDEGDFRPGHRAATEFSVRAPLLEAGLRKDAVRRLAQALDLPVWDKPASACLASRVPYGTPIDAAVLQRIDRAEDGLRRLGFRQVRVRHHGDVARIELPPADVGRAATAARSAITALLKEQGWLYVTLDLAGYVQGSLNAALRTDR